MSLPLLAVDPGKDKCGLAVVAPDGSVLLRQIVSTGQIEDILPKLLQNHGIGQIIVGNSTTSRAMRKRLGTLVPGMQITAVDEKNSTLEARALYWQENPPRGWRKVLPLSLQEPPEPVDDFAAVVLALRFLKELGA